MKFCIFLMSLVTSMAFAGEHGESSIKELAWPAFNFSILFAVIIWKARKPIHDIFTTKSRKVQELVRFAENKFNEAKKRYDDVSEKMKNVEKESEKIMHEAHVEAEDLELRFHEEVRDRTERMWQDSHHVIEAERRQLESELHQEVIELVVTQTKDKIRSSSDFKKKASNKLLESVK